MNYGFAAYNAADERIIDQDFINMGIWIQGAVGYYGTSLDPAPPDCPTAATTCVDETFCRSFQYREGSEGTPYKVMHGPGSPGDTIVPYTLALPSNYLTAGTGGFGLAVFDAYGRVVFSSQAQALRIVDVIETPTPARGDSVILSHRYVQQPWYILDGLFGYIRDKGYDRWRTTLHNIDNTSCRFRLRNVEGLNDSQSHRDWTQEVCQLVVCTITNV